MSAPPARGARDGVRQDIQRLKDSGAGFEAGPATTAWTHDFLNKKPWHPLNFRNQIKRFDAEQAAIAREKSEATAKAEFEAEQQYLETLAHMPSAEADKYRHMQGVSWMYIKPPGMAAAEEAAAKREQQGARAEQHSHSGRPADASSSEDPKRHTRPKTAAERGLGSQGALPQLNSTLKRRRASPPIGGFEWGKGNQAFIDDDDDAVAHVPAAKAAEMLQMLSDTYGRDKRTKRRERKAHKKDKKHCKQAEASKGARETARADASGSSSDEASERERRKRRKARKRLKQEHAGDVRDQSPPAGQAHAHSNGQCKRSIARTDKHGHGERASQARSKRRHHD